MTRDVLLDGLELRHFKGIESFELDLAGGCDAIVRGDNATGKTTLHDAYAWLLFGKDAANRSVFGIKTVDETGRAASGLEHQVVGTFTLGDGATVELSRTYAETWKKRRGSSTKELTGHSTAYAIDGVPMKKADYDARVAELFGPEDRLRMLTDPLYFAAVLPWADRRNVLLDLVGAPAEEELVEAEPELEELADLDRDPDDERKVLEQRRKRVNGELSKLPVRIDEANRSLDGLPTIPKGLAKEIEKAEALEARLEDELRAARATPKRDEILAKRRKATEAIEDRKAYLRKRLAAETSDLEAERKRIETFARQLEREISTGLDEGRLRRLEARLEELRKAYADRQARDEAVSDVEESCPSCGQSLPADRVAEARRKASEEAKARKARKLREIYEEAEHVSKRLEVEKADVEQLNAARAEKERELEEERARLEPIKARLDELAVSAPFKDDEELEDLRGTLAAIEADLEKLDDGETAGTTELEEALSEAKGDLARLRGLESARRQHETVATRVDELRKEERQLAAEVETIDRRLYLLDLRTRVRARLLTDRLNERFELVAFRLFDEQLNGALVETCDVTVDGVPWDDLNHGARMNAGLDVLRVLGQHFELSAPVWLDNAESVTRWLEIDAQTIRLEVSDDAAALEVELLN